MSIASELSRIQQAKSDLATSIANKGVTVPAATTIDGYAALVDQIQQGGTPVLPYDSKIEYLEATGTQYIETQAKAWYTTPLDVRARLSFSVFGTNMALSSGTTGNNRAFILSAGASGSNLQWNFGVGSNHLVGSITLGTVYDVQAHVQNNNSWLIVDGKILSTVTDSLSSNNLTLAIFARHKENGFDLVSKVKLYSLSWSGNGMSQELIPVRVGQVGYLYDKVSGTLLENQGTGNYNLGPDIT